MEMIKRLISVLPVFLLCVVLSAKAEPTASVFASAVVQLNAVVKPEARTIPALGRQRAGSAIVIDASGLLVTVGYLVLEAEEVTVTFADGSSSQARVVVNDEASGLALLRTTLPESVKAIPLGDSTIVGIDQDAVVISNGGTENAHVTRVASIREFAGGWEYLLERAFYTAPATRSFSGAALINRDAELIGIGSLLLSDISAGTSSMSQSGNLFIPVEHLRSNFGKLLTGQQSVKVRPWLGMTLKDALPDIEITRIALDSPASEAGLKPADTLIAINNQRVNATADFYRKLWSTGNAGTSVELLISRRGELQTITAVTATRASWLR